MMTEATKRTIRDLSFIKEGRWSPIRTNCTQQDNEHGRACAQEMLELIAETENPAIFGSIVRAITEGGVYSAVEAGFCSFIGIYIAVNQKKG